MSFTTSEKRKHSQIDIKLKFYQVIEDDQSYNFNGNFKIQFNTLMWQ